MCEMNQEYDTLNILFMSYFHTISQSSHEACNFLKKYRLLHGAPLRAASGDTAPPPPLHIYV